MIAKTYSAQILPTNTKSFYAPNTYSYSFHNQVKLKTKKVVRKDHKFLLVFSHFPIAKTMG